MCIRDRYNIKKLPIPQRKEFMIEQLSAEATECDFKVALETKKPPLMFEGMDRDEILKAHAGKVIMTVGKEGVVYGAVSYTHLDVYKRQPSGYTDKRNHGRCHPCFWRDVPCRIP